MMKNVCQRCRIYYPNNCKLESCPRCGDPVFDEPDSKKFKPYYYDSSTSQVRMLSADLISSGIPNSVASKKSAISGKSAVHKNNAAVSVIDPPKADNASARAVSDPVRSHTSPARNYNTPAIASPSGVRESRVGSADRKRVYSGIINNYEHMEIGRQSFFENAALFFKGMHHGITRHIITFVDEDDGQTYRVCFYGEFSAVISSLPQIGEHITVMAAPNGNDFYTENVYIGANGGRRIRLRNQRPEGAGGSPALPIIIVLALCAIVYLLLSGGASALWNSLVTFVIVFIVALVICTMTLLRVFRFRTIAIISVIIAAAVTLLLHNTGGISSNIISGALVLGLTIYGVWMIITAGRR